MVKLRKASILEAGNKMEHAQFKRDKARAYLVKAQKASHELEWAL